MPSELARRYKSSAQRARVVTEAWGARNLYCPACASPALSPAPPGTRVFDFSCPRCDSPFQLKSQSRPYGSRIVDSAYGEMIRAIREGRTPNLLALHYDIALWRVANLILVPAFAFSLSYIEKRNALGPNARRAGWVGCSILLGNIPADARIPLVSNGVPGSVASVREKYARLRPLAKVNHEARGWTLDVLNVVRGLGKREFSLAEIYAQAGALERLHPENKNVEAKIRQQLQRLRDLGLIRFMGDGRYRA